MLLLSIDVGTTNLGLAVVRIGPDHTGDLVDFSLLCCSTTKKPSIQRACRDVQRALSKYLGDCGHTFSRCVIEAQPMRNCRTKVLSHCIQVMMLERGCERVDFVSPKKKLRRKYATYRERKLAAVEKATAIIAQYPALYERFSKLSKKDDIADAILQTQLRFPLK